VLELAILGLLKEQDLHGYELKKRLAEVLGVVSAVSFGSLYPALNRLEALGALQVQAEESTSRPVPATGSLGGELAAFRARRTPARAGRSRKVYRISPQGERHFEQLLLEGGRAAEDDRYFTLRLAFARYLSPDARRGLLDRRRAVLIGRLDTLTQRDRSRRGAIDRYLRLLAERDHEVVQRELAWLDRLMAEELTDGAAAEQHLPAAQPDPVPDHHLAAGGHQEPAGASSDSATTSSGRPHRPRLGHRSGHLVAPLVSGSQLRPPVEPPPVAPPASSAAPLAGGPASPTSEMKTSLAARPAKEGSTT
jgi:DNA-binding PadR family transcriptional regulator